MARAAGLWNTAQWALADLRELLWIAAACQNQGRAAFDPHVGVGRELRLQSAELRVVVGFVGVALGDVIIEHAQFADTLKNLTRNFESSILCLQERNGVADVARRGRGLGCAGIE